MTKAVITKISDEQILLKRYYSSGALKYTSRYGMPDELRDRLNSEKEITLENYETPGRWRGESWMKVKIDGASGEWWHENGQKSREGKWKNGRNEGEWTEWHENGQKSRVMNYKFGRVDGKMSSWHDNGQKRLERNYKKGLKDGRSITWNREGRIKSEEIFEKGHSIESIE